MGNLIVSNRFNNNVERHNRRDMAYSKWHRTVDGAAYVDIDSVEMCRACQRPIALIELARDVGQDIYQKRAHVTKYMATELGLDAYVCFYKLGGDDEITAFRAIKITPTSGKEHHFSPEGWGNYLLKLQRDHQAVCVRNRKMDIHFNSEVKKAA